VCVYSTVLLVSRFHCFSLQPLQRLCLTPLLCVRKLERCVNENTLSCVNMQPCLALWMIIIQLILWKQYLCWVIAVWEWMNTLII